MKHSTNYQTTLKYKTTDIYLSNTSNQGDAANLGRREIVAIGVQLPADLSVRRNGDPLLRIQHTLGMRDLPVHAVPSLGAFSASASQDSHRDVHWTV